MTLAIILCTALLPWTTLDASAAGGNQTKRPELKVEIKEIGEENRDNSINVEPETKKTAYGTVRLESGMDMIILLTNEK